MTWHEACNNFDSRIDASASDVNFNDTVFLLTQADAETPGGDQVRANKAILSLISPVFYAQFYGPLATNNDGPIQVVDGTAQGFKQLINFICLPTTFQLQVNHVAEVFNISYFAHKYQIQSLISFCRQFLGEVDIENSELDALNWALSSEHGLSMKESFPIEHALMVHHFSAFIETNFKDIFPNGKLKECDDLPDEDLMIKILGSRKRFPKQELELSVALDYYSKLMEKSQKIVKGRKKLKMNMEKEWDKKLDKIKSVVSLKKVRPKTLAKIYKKFFNKIPDKIMGKITMEISSNWENKDTFPRPNTQDGPEAKFSLVSGDDPDDWIHDDQLVSPVRIKFKTNQNAIMRLDFEEVVECTCYDFYCCGRDSIVFQNDHYVEEILGWTDSCYFYVKANKEATITYERKCEKEASCDLHLERMKQFNFSKGHFQVNILEINGSPVTSPCYTFIQNLFFDPV